MLSRPLTRRASAVALRASFDSVASRLLGNQQQKNQPTNLPPENSAFFCFFCVTFGAFPRMLSQKAKTKE